MQLDNQIGKNKIDNERIRRDTLSVVKSEITKLLRSSDKTPSPTPPIRPTPGMSFGPLKLNKDSERK